MEHPERMDLSMPYAPIEFSIHSLRYIPVREVVRDSIVYDLGCGQGIGSHLLATTLQAKHVYGFDIDEESLSEATKIHDGSLSFLPADLSKGLVDIPADLPSPDVIVCVETIEHLQDPRPLLKDLNRYAAMGTKVLLSCPNDRFYYGPGPSLNPYHLASYSFLDFRNLLEDSMTDVADQISWYFGSFASGFSLDEAAIDDTAGRSWWDILESSSLKEMNTYRVPGRLGNRTPRDTLFYVACVNFSPNPAATLIASPATYRQPNPSSVSEKTALGMKQRLTIIADTPGWAFSNIAMQIRSHLGDRYVIDVKHITDYERPDDLIYEVFFSQKTVPDLVHFLWRETWLNFVLNPSRLKRFCERFELTSEDLARGLSEVTVTGTVYDHLHLDRSDDEVASRARTLSAFDAYSVASRRLFQEYGRLGGETPVVVTADGVDLELFAPVAEPRSFDPSERSLVVGWVGNSAWNASSDRDPKGLRTVLIPAIESLRRQGLAVELELADRAVTWRPHDEMPSYYSSIDVLVCSSEHEGTPNPVLEAMAMGLPIVSTDVGIVREVVGETQRTFVVKERTPEALAKQLRRFVDNPRLLKRLREENLRSIQAWSWESRMRSWLRLFAVAEQRHASRRVSRYTLVKTALAGGYVHARVKAKPIPVRVEGALAQQVQGLRKEVGQLREQVTEAGAVTATQRREDVIDRTRALAGRVRHGLRWRAQRLRRKLRSG